MSKPPVRRVVMILSMERAKGIEPSSQAWEARILPMNYARITCLFYHSFTRISRVIGKSYSECVEKVIRNV